MENVNDFSIRLKEKLDFTDYKHINELQDICIAFDGVALKLELDFKLSRAEKQVGYLNNINEFMYFHKETLIGYLGICQFGRDTMEINGMVHPEFRRMGIFKKLFLLVKDEINRRNPKTVLLLSDNNSASGIEFIKLLGATHHHSEYEMFVKKEANKQLEKNNIILRKAKNNDGREIAYQNSIYFNEEFNEQEISKPEEEEKCGLFIYVAELEEKIIGKVNLEVTNGVGGIFGLGVRPEYRGKGYGREILMKAIEILKEKGAKDIMLQVEAKNSNALNLYKSCGFEETSTMNYYEL